MNDDNLNYRFRLITFNNNASVENPDPRIEIPSVPEEPKPVKYALSSEYKHSDAPDATHSASKPQTARLSKSSTEIMAKKASESKAPRQIINTISAKDFNRMITSQDNAFPDKLIDSGQVNAKDKNFKDIAKINREKRKIQNHRWQKDVKVIYTSETTKIPRRRRTYYQPPDHYAYHAREFRDDFDSLYKNDYYQQNVFKNNPAVYFQSSGDCSRKCNIFSKKKKPREKDTPTCDHFPVANMGDFCDEESPSSYNCTHLPHLNVIGFPQEQKTKIKYQLPPQDHGEKCSQSLTTINFKDYKKPDPRFMPICSQPCPSVGHAHVCQKASTVHYENESGRANKIATEAKSKKIREREPTPTNSCPKNISESKTTTKKTSAKLCCQQKSTKTSSIDTETKQTCACSVTTKTRSTTPKRTRSERSQSKPSPANAHKTGFFKYFCYGIAGIVFFPCVLLFSLCWLVTYPLRPHQAVPNLSKQSTQNNCNIRKPRERNLCHFNRAPKALTNTIDNNWCSIRQAVSCACKSALPSSPKIAESHCSSLKKKNTASKESGKKVSNGDCDEYPIRIPPCAIKTYGVKHPDPSQQYRMFYGGALRGWLMKPLNCYGVTCKRKNRSYRNVCPTTVMPVKTEGKTTSLTNEDNKSSKKGKKEKKAVKFSKELATPMPNTSTTQRPVKKGEIRPCTDPRPTKKPCRVCCQTIKPDLNPSSVGLVQYGADKKGKKKKKKKKKKEEKKKKIAKKSKAKKKKKKKKKNKKKDEERKGLLKTIQDAEDEAWGDEPVKCDQIWVRTLRKRPCFWIYKWWPGLYPCFLQWHSCCANCFTCCIMCVSTIFWCPMLICFFICYRGICK